MLKNKTVLTFFVLVLCVAGVLAFRALKPDPEAMLKKRIAERSVGDPKAALWITEYFDYQCPPCGVARNLLEDAIKKHPGKIYLQVRYFPLPAHKNSLKAAVHAECASHQPGKFWAMHDKIFEHQSEWAMDSYPELRFLNYAQEAGLDLPKWDACTKDPEIQKSITEEKTKGETLGVKITPTFFINGKMFVGNQALSEELKKLENAPAPAS